MGLLKFEYEYELASFFGLSTSAFSQRKARGSVPVDKIATACGQYGWNFNYVMTGDKYSFPDELNPESQEPPPHGKSSEALANNEIDRLTEELKKEKESLSTAEFYKVMAGVYGVLEKMKKEREGHK